MKHLQELGFSQFFLSQVDDFESESTRIARVVAVERDRIKLYFQEQIVVAIASKETALDLCIGDFCLVTEDSHLSEIKRIERVFERKSLLRRKTAGQSSRHQLIAANVDTVFLVTSLNEEFNLSRLERYLLAVRDSKADPVVVLTKRDLCKDERPYFDDIKKLRSDIPVISINGLSAEGVEQLEGYLRPGQTLVFVGSSGVGKSTLSNLLSGNTQQQTQEISFEAKGRHTTTRKDFIFLPTGAMLIDTPGMKEFATVATQESLSEEFSDIEDLATRCKYRNCEHQSEPGCAVQEAIADGRLDQRRLTNFNKLTRERLRQESREHQQNQKRRWKSVSKQLRQHKKDH